MLADASYLTNEDPWAVLACVLLRAQQGDLEAVSVLPDPMARNDEALVWSGCVQLLGFAGKASLVFDTAQRFLSSAHDEGLSWSLSTLMLNACSLRAVEPLLKLRRVATQDTRQHIQYCLSILLEDGLGEIDDGPDARQLADPAYPEPFTQWKTVFDDEGYADKVRSMAAGVASRLDHPEQSISAGKPLDLQAVTLDLYEHIRAGAESTTWMEWARMFFEASTGLNCSGFYQNYRLQPLAAMAVLEDFLESEGARHFELGTRYFFRRPVA